MGYLVSSTTARYNHAAISPCDHNGWKSSLQVTHSFNRNFRWKRKLAATTQPLPKFPRLHIAECLGNWKEIMTRGNLLKQPPFFAPGPGYTWGSCTKTDRYHYEPIFTMSQIAAQQASAKVIVRHPSLRSGWWYWCSVGIWYDWKVRRRIGVAISGCRTGRKWDPLPAGLPGHGPFSSFSLPQSAAWVTVQSWTGLSSQSSFKPSGLRLQLPTCWGRYPRPLSPFGRHLCIAVEVWGWGRLPRASSP